MTIDATTTVRELAIGIPHATRIFEKLGIDYCCGGEKLLGDACLAATASVEEVVGLLKETTNARRETSGGPDWQNEPLSRLCSHIVSKHHTFTRRELARLTELMEKVCLAHGKNHPELLNLQSLLNDLEQELTSHMHKEEQILFPYIHQIEAAKQHLETVPTPFFGTVRNPVRMMMLEHDSAGQHLQRMRSASSNYSVPADACISFQTLYQAMETFEQDLHQHIHLENNILFPRALKMEVGTTSSTVEQ